MTSQPLEALAKANEVRFRHAEYRRHVAALPPVQGAWYLAEILDARGGGEETSIDDATVVYALCAIHRVRLHRAERLLSAAEVKRRWTRESSSKTNRLLRIRELTENEAWALADVLRESFPLETKTTTGENG